GGGPSGAPLGAAWVRLFPGDAPGYGWVGDDVPELAMAVRPSSRGMGFGRTLLTAVLRASRAAGYQRVSLSVDPANTAARRLYDSSGFRATGGSGTSTTMVVDL
ncbi:MAG TPA: GNAT family N-acetyltransferase, partial [Acidimicrobiia bacterium]|nr:GNAT family N-acetyltransferase [Acidimicrobiia bacterium]